MTWNSYFFLNLFHYVYIKIEIKGPNLDVMCLQRGLFVPTEGPLHFYIKVIELF